MPKDTPIQTHADSPLLKAPEVYRPPPAKELPDSEAVRICGQFDANGNEVVRQLVGEAYITAAAALAQSVPEHVVKPRSFKSYPARVLATLRRAHASKLEDIERDGSIRVMVSCKIETAYGIPERVEEFIIIPPHGMRLQTQLALRIVSENREFLTIEPFKG